jgi:hypothetical protein
MFGAGRVAMISIAALRDVLAAFKAKDMPSKEALEARFARDLEILQSRQRDDGSFGLWKRDKERYEYPFLTVHVAHALVLAKQKGYKVPDEMLNKVKPYLKNVESHFNDEWYTKSQQVRWTISAYALYVRDLMGDKDVGKAKKLLADAVAAGASDRVDVASGDKPAPRYDRMPFEALGWILSVMATDRGSAADVESIIRFLMNRTTETAAAANFVTDYGDGAWLIMYSNRRADGVLLEALIKAQPKNDLIPNSSADFSIIESRVRGRIRRRMCSSFSRSTSTSRQFEKVTPDFVTRVWLGRHVRRRREVPRSFGRFERSHNSDVVLVQQGGTSNLLLDKQGAGRLYYRIGNEVRAVESKTRTGDYGFTVLRKYEAIDNADDVKQNADGSWTIKSGRVFESV